MFQSLESRTLFAAGDLLPDVLPTINANYNVMLGWKYGASQEFMPGKTLLRFGNAVANIGAGPLEISADQIITNPAPGQTVTVSQRIYNSNGSSSLRPAGFLEFHDAGSHHHWHFEDLALYNLRAVTPGNGVGEILRTGGKAGFCLLDSFIHDFTRPGTPPIRVYDHDCYPISGISVGWADLYDRTIDFQWIDVTNIPAGQYWLESIADPENKILESNESNNTIRLQITINPPKLGDANGDGQTNNADFNILKANYNQGNRSWNQGDFTGDSKVNFLDYQVLSLAMDPAPVTAPAASNAIPLKPTKPPLPVFKPIKRDLFGR